MMRLQKINLLTGTALSLLLGVVTVYPAMAQDMDGTTGGSSGPSMNQMNSSQTITGTIKRVSGNVVTVQMANGQTRNITLNSNDMQAQNLRVGTRIVATIMNDGTVGRVSLVNGSQETVSTTTTTGMDMNGQTGMTGMNGQTGMTGMNGQTGMTGMNGQTGMTGMNGQTGMTGMNGQTDMTGMNGQTGMTGMNGQTSTSRTMTSGSTTSSQGMTSGTDQTSQLGQDNTSGNMTGMSGDNTSTTTNRVAQTNRSTITTRATHNNRATTTNRARAAQNRPAVRALW
ncbi:MAG TPA: hypothetical protein V6D16_02835 [Candidatus Obscuribacterales bacterium]